MEQEPAVDFSRDGAIATITLNRPEARNGISTELVDGLVDACRRLDDDASIKCAILAANGRIFCAGGNLNAMYERSGHFAGSSAEMRRYYLHGVQRLARAFYALEVPVVAAVNGPAIGAGLDMVLLCDIRIASERALFAENFIRLGLVSAAGGAWLLQRAVGPAAAAELTLSGDNFDAQRALQLGVVSRVVPEEALMDEARAIARSIARHPAHAIRLNKRLLRESQHNSLQTSLELSASFQGITQHTEDHREAVAAVVQKRPPAFKDR